MDKGAGGGLENWIIFMEVICVLSLTSWSLFSVEEDS